LVVTAGDRIRADVFRRFDQRHGTLVSLYGSTEMGAIAAGYKDDPVEIRADSIGKGLPGVRLRVDPATASDANGEVLCKHPNGFEGYFIAPSKSAEGGIAEAPEWLTTGDFGRLSRDGYLEVLGRKDHTVNRDGVLVVLREIEGILEGIVGVKRAVIVVKPGAKRGAYLVAICVPGQDPGITADKIRQQCFDLLPRYAVPDSVRLVDNIPTLPSGKVDRRKTELLI
jgi:acyl-CoA synthetase (AMP-forming)/AMP-acid ligase II